jgi:hypothetical protein
MGNQRRKSRRQRAVDLSAGTAPDEKTGRRAHRDPDGDVVADQPRQGGAADESQSPPGRHPARPVGPGKDAPRPVRGGGLVFLGVIVVLMTVAILAQFLVGE